MEPSTRAIFAAEAIGTGVLVLVGPGARSSPATPWHAGVALAFGFALLAMTYTIGHVSGCHVNPAVTLAFFLARKVGHRPGVRGTGSPRCSVRCSGSRPVHRL